MKKIRKERIASILMLIISVGLGIRQVFFNKEEFDILLVSCFLYLGWNMYIINRKK